MNSPYIAAMLGAARRTSRERAGLGVTALFYAALILVFDAVWAAYTSATPVVEGYDHHDLVWYIIGAEIPVVALRQRMIEEVGDDIANGNMEAELLRPVSVLGLRIARAIGESVVRAGAVVAVAVPLGLLLTGYVPDAANLVFALCAVLCSIVCGVVAMHLFAALAFWVSEAKLSWFLYQKLVFLLGGMLIPPQLLPDGLASVMKFLPFWTTPYAPARILSGHLEPWLLLGQLAWLVVLAAGAYGLFRAGVRRLQLGKI